MKHNAKLTAATVQRIRERAQERMQLQIQARDTGCALTKARARLHSKKWMAVDYGVCRSTVFEAEHGYTWRWVNGT